jgi:diguanylate cyclase (GGDEF)-like protein/PAS domain S-box-containing protein
MTRKGGPALSAPVAAIKRALPRGKTLPEDAWERRHKAMLSILWVHVPALFIFARARGYTVAGSLDPVIPVALAGVAAMLRAPGRRARSIAVVIGLLTASAVLVHAWNGQIEAHFHFFVMIAVLALYEDWLPFGFAVGYVVAEHGLVGAIAPHSVYNHSGSPWAWAGVHGFFVLGAAAASITTWRLNEDMRARMGEANRNARETAERFRHAFESGVTGMALIAADGRYMRVNRALCDITGYTEEQMLALDFQAITHPDDAVADRDQQRALLAGTVDTYDVEKRYIHRDGHEVWVQLGVSAVREEGGRVRYFISQCHDVTARRRFEEELAHRALHDPLTGLPNRALFLDRLRHALVRLRRHDSELAVLFVDLDRFKLVNDALGHRIGDAVLVEAAKRLESASRAEDTVARFGGDEFTILCEDADHAAAREVAERVLEEFARPFSQDGHEFHLSASVGIRVGGPETSSPDNLLRDADMALYAAKEHGRSRLELFDPAVPARVDVLATEQALRIALRDGELRLHYQPSVDLDSGNVTGLEALVRWQHPTRGLVPPGDFIPVAEETGLIVSMGEWVLREACTQLAQWRSSGVVGPGVRMAVNVSARQLSHPGLPGAVAATLEETRIDPRALCLEITESAVVQDTEVALRSLNAIKALGVVIALDDFGVGFSSLSQIRELPPVDVIKLDRSFTAGLGQNDSDGAIVGAVLSLARSLGLTAVAEGVETLDQLGRLRGLGWDVGQGFYFARPQAAADIERVLSAGGPLPQTPAIEGERARV